MQGGRWRDPQTAKDEHSICVFMSGVLIPPARPATNTLGSKKRSSPSALAMCHRQRDPGYPRCGGRRTEVAASRTDWPERIGGTGDVFQVAEDADQPSRAAGAAGGCAAARLAPADRSWRRALHRRPAARPQRPHDQRRRPRGAPASTLVQEYLPILMRSCGNDRAAAEGAVTGGCRIERRSAGNISCAGVSI